MVDEARCDPSCNGRQHERGCPGEQAWDIPGACNCSRPKCRQCAAKKGVLTRALMLKEETK